jgi:cephalosporin-C deacetylase-like acetyl esterase
MERPFPPGWMDMICPHLMVLAAYHHYAGSKIIRVYSFNQHKGNGDHYNLEGIVFLTDLCFQPAFVDNPNRV